MTFLPCFLRTIRVLTALIGFSLLQGMAVASSVSGQVSSSGTLSPSKVKSGSTLSGTAVTGQSFKVVFTVPSLSGARIRGWQVTGAIPAGLKISSGVQKSGYIATSTKSLVFAGTPSKGGAYALRLKATYSNGRTVTALYSLTVKQPVKFLAQPASKSILPGTAVTFSVKTSGFPQPSYQWYKGSTKLVGKTSATLTLSNVSTAAAGKYHVVATNSSGSVKSSAATLTVINDHSGGTIIVAPPSDFGSPPPSTISSGSLSLSGGASLSSLLNLSANTSTLTSGLLVNNQPLVFQAAVPDQTRPLGPWTLSGYTYSSSALPSWLSVDSTTGVLTGNPRITDAGTYSVTVSATRPEDTLSILLTIVVE